MRSEDQSHGVKFLQDTYGKQLIPFDEVNQSDIVLIPAFGTTLEIEKMLNEKGIHTESYNTTCPFVEKVWNRSEAIAKKDFSVIIHGKPGHEETRATFSHAAFNAPSVVLKDMHEAELLADFILKEKPDSEFYQTFHGQFSNGFIPSLNLQKIGVVNQTTMLASDTQAIADFLRNVMVKKYGSEEIASHFADTRDTLCYATNDNQSAVTGMLKTNADLAIVVGGYNSSNTSHLVDLCEEKLPTYFINNEEKILSQTDILHYYYHSKQEVLTSNYLPKTLPARILITSGASCPDAVVEAVVRKLMSYFPIEKTVEEVLAESLQK